MRVALMLILAALTAGAQDRPAGQGVNLYSLEKEAALGASLAAEIQGRSTPIKSVAVRDFVNRIGSRLSARLPAAPFPYTFAVIAGDLSNPAHEPIAVPGGYIFVPAELILAAKDEAELAGMLAHAMVHVSERHFTRQATRAEIANQATVPLILAGGWAGYGMRQDTQIAVPLSMLRFQRAFETQADELAVTITSGAGIDPSALVRYIDRVQASEPGTTGRVFALLPLREERVSSIETAIQALPKQTYTASDPDEFGRIQAEVRQMAPLAERLPLRRVVGGTDRRPTLKPGN
jgi:beta-barrel assembly-enhancing protease